MTKKQRTLAQKAATTVPPDRIIGLPRHKFRGAGSDSVSCDWMIWDPTTPQMQRAIVIDYGAKDR